MQVIGPGSPLSIVGAHIGGFHEDQLSQFEQGIFSSFCSDIFDRLSISIFRRAKWFKPLSRPPSPKSKLNFQVELPSHSTLPLPSFLVLSKIAMIFPVQAKHF